MKSSAHNKTLYRPHAADTQALFFTNEPPARCNYCDTALKLFHLVSEFPALHHLCTKYIIPSDVRRSLNDKDRATGILLPIKEIQLVTKI